LNQMRKNNFRILVVDDSQDALEVVQSILEDQGYCVRTCSCVDQALKILDQSVFDIIITDLRMPKISGLDLIRHVRENLKDVEIMMITGYPTIEGAVAAVKTGAEHYLAKPFTEKELTDAVQAIAEKLIRKRAAHGKEPVVKNFGIIGTSHSMRMVYRQIQKAGETKATVLISGESGTGKELVARAIHRAGSSGLRPFVSVNCTAIPENLIESELFGHVKGAFTGAGSTRTGFFQIADGGTLFLDEIGDASLAFQAKLLRAIQEKVIYRVGATVPIPVDMRLICATNKQLLRLIDKGLFREDLYYRINVIDIFLPPLRERREDILPLISYFHGKFAKEMERQIPFFSDGALRQLMAYPWPGNVRELENLVQKLVLMVDGDTVDVSDLPETMKSNLISSGGPDRSLEDLEAEYIRDVLDSVSGNKTKAAAILEIDRKTLRRKLKAVRGRPEN
jgi:two-component system, NtrC family, response regulator HydG